MTTIGRFHIDAPCSLLPPLRAFPFKLNATMILSSNRCLPSPVLYRWHRPTFDLSVRSSCFYKLCVCAFFRLCACLDVGYTNFVFFCKFQTIAHTCAVISSRLDACGQQKKATVLLSSVFRLDKTSFRMRASSPFSSLIQYDSYVNRFTTNICE